jgi:hypothetical protein
VTSESRIKGGTLDPFLERKKQVRIYSHYFTTIYDEQGPKGSIGTGAHYSILRALDPVNQGFHDFAIVWDEDHDTRSAWVAEKLYEVGALTSVLALGERKGNLSILVHEAFNPSAVISRLTLGYRNDGVACIEIPDGDCFPVFADKFPGPGDTFIIHDKKDRVHDYLRGVHAIWQLGHKPFTSLVGSDLEDSRRRGEHTLGSLLRDPATRADPGGWQRELDRARKLEGRK